MAASPNGSMSTPGGVSSAPARRSAHSSAAPPGSTTTMSPSSWRCPRCSPISVAVAESARRTRAPLSSRKNSFSGVASARCTPTYTAPSFQTPILVGAALEQFGETHRLGHALRVRVVGPEQHLAGTDSSDQGLHVVLRVGRHVAELLEGGAGPTGWAATDPLAETAHSLLLV